MVAALYVETNVSQWAFWGASVLFVAFWPGIIVFALWQTRRSADSGK